MKSPSKLDAELVKEFNIGEVSDLEPMFKLAYVRSQLDEFKKMLYRNRVDILLSEKLIENENEVMSDKGRQNKTEYRNNARQLVGAIEVLEDLKNELEATVEASE